MTSNQYRSALSRLDLTQVGAARLFRVDERTSRKWAAGDRSIPAPVQILIRLMLSGKITAADIEAV